MNFWLQVNTNGAWRNVVESDESRKEEVLAAVARLAAAGPGSKWSLLYPDGRRRWVLFDPHTGRASLSTRIRDSDGG